MTAKMTIDLLKIRFESTGPVQKSQSPIQSENKNSKNKEVLTTVIERVPKKRKQRKLIRCGFPRTKCPVCENCYLPTSMPGHLMRIHRISKECGERLLKQKKTSSKKRKSTKNISREISSCPSSLSSSSSIPESSESEKDSLEDILNGLNEFTFSLPTSDTNLEQGLKTPNNILSDSDLGYILSDIPEMNIEDLLSEDFLF